MELARKKQVLKQELAKSKQELAESKQETARKEKDLAKGRQESEEFTIKGG